MFAAAVVRAVVAAVAVRGEGRCRAAAGRTDRNRDIELRMGMLTSNKHEDLPEAELE